METQAEKIISQQKESWNKFAFAWEKWDSIAQEHKRFVSDRMIELLNLKKTDYVIDIASGSGEPAVLIAEIVTDGKVTATDLSEEMLMVAERKAKNRGLKNFETRICESDKLPFKDETFDAVSCRFGFMFFPDMNISLKETMRVLKPGGKIVASVWDAPQKNVWVTSIVEAMKKYIEIPPPPPPDMPGMFRCSAKNFMKDLFEKGGLKNVSEIEIKGYDLYEKPDTYWDISTEMSAQVVTLLEKTDNDTKMKIRDELFSILSGKQVDGKIKLDSAAIIAYGEK